MTESSPVPSPQQSSEYIRNIGLDIVLTLLTCGVWNIFLQSRQMAALNAILRQEKYSFWPWFFLTVITCGIYHIYHEFRMSTDLAEVAGKAQGSDSVVALILTACGLSIVVDAIQQVEINKYFGSNAI